jgi:hypothetical protein
LRIDQEHRGAAEGALTHKELRATILLRDTDTVVLRAMILEVCPMRIVGCLEQCKGSV